MSRGWNAFRDCPHNVFCLSQGECEKREKRSVATRDGQPELPGLFECPHGGHVDYCAEGGHDQ